MATFHDDSSKTFDPAALKSSRDSDLDHVTRRSSRDSDLDHVTHCSSRDSDLDHVTQRSSRDSDLDLVTRRSSRDSGIMRGVVQNMVVNMECVLGDIQVRMGIHIAFRIIFGVYRWLKSVQISCFP